MAETEYYASLQKDYRPVQMLAWFVVLLVAGAGIFAGLNTMYGATIGRIRELATLQTIAMPPCDAAESVQEAPFLRRRLACLRRSSHLCC